MLFSNLRPAWVSFAATLALGAGLLCPLGPNGSGRVQAQVIVPGGGKVPGGRGKGFLGVQIKNDPAGQGITVVRVLPNTPAARGGVKPGDVIAKVDNAASGTVRFFLNTMAAHQPGDQVELLILRGGKQIKRTVTVADTPAWPPTVDR